MPKMRGQCVQKVYETSLQPLHQDKSKWHTAYEDNQMEALLLLSQRSLRNLRREFRDNILKTRPFLASTSFPIHHSKPSYTIRSYGAYAVEKEHR
jgi:hypothetical protein